MAITWRSDFYGWKETTKYPPFTDEEYIALNDNIQLIKYDPKVIKAFRPSEARNLEDLFQDFTVYQFPKISEYRRFPLRVIYSKKHGKKFELKGTNEPIYELMRYLKLAKLLPDDWILKNKNMYRYVLFFFDNVAGRHGRFDLIDLLNRSESPVDQLINRIDNFYRLPHQKELSKADVRTNYENKFREELGEEFTDKYDKIIKSSISTFLSNVRVEISKESGKQGDCWVCKNLYMAFKNSLFRADIRFDANEKNYGYISMENEELYVLNLSKDNEGTIMVRVQPEKSQESDSDLPQDEKRSSTNLEELLFL